jgi:tRNA (guanine37-N1)-methyltransferase
MILKPEPIFAAVEALNSKLKIQNSKIILLTPQGQLFNQKKAEEFSKLDHIILICGHYEGVDERVRKHLVDEELSIGDYILTGGELPAMVVTDAIVRLIPGALEKPEATESESFSTFGSQLSTLEYPQYTKPREFRGHKVPEILLSGNHQEIKKWRQQEALKRTKQRRPDLLHGSGTLGS